MKSKTHPSVLGSLRLHHDTRTGALTYVLQGGNQTAVDKSGTSLDTYIHALYGLLRQTPAKNILMIGCGGGVLGRMLAAEGRAVTIIDIDKTSFTLAHTYFGLPKKVRCHVTDGLVFMQRTRQQFDAVIVDAFIGEDIPPQFTGDAFCVALRRCLARNGRMLMNVCVDTKADPTADDVALRLKQHDWSVRILDQRGTARNAIVLAGNVKDLRRPTLHHVPQIEVGRVRRELTGMHFRRVSAQK